MKPKRIAIDSDEQSTLEHKTNTAAADKAA
jgi:hypothetical protein